MSELRSIRDRAVALIEGIEPVERPDVPFHRGGRVPLGRQAPTGRLRREGFRRFAVRFGRNIAIGATHNPLSIVRELVVEVRYELHDSSDDWDELTLYAASDEDLIIQALTRPSPATTWAGLSVSTPQLRPAAGLLPSESEHGVWINTLRFSVDYELDC